jgi:hypothetical protein
MRRYTHNKILYFRNRAASMTIRRRRNFLARVYQDLPFVRMTLFVRIKISRTLTVYTLLELLWTICRIPALVRTATTIYPS